MTKKIQATRNLQVRTIPKLQVDKNCELDERYCFVKMHLIHKIRGEIIERLIQSLDVHI